MQVRTGFPSTPRPAIEARIQAHKAPWSPRTTSLTARAACTSSTRTTAATTTSSRTHRTRTTWYQPLISLLKSAHLVAINSRTETNDCALPYAYDSTIIQHAFLTTELNFGWLNPQVVSHNTFLHIDQENFYGSQDTHAIGIQGGSRCVYEHNYINGVGGSGITFYQGPGQE
jgi:hypothetical protein